MEAQINTMLVLVMGALTFKVLLVIIFDRIQNRHSVVSIQFGNVSEVLLRRDPNLFQFDKDVITLRDHIRNHSQDTITGILFGVSLLMGYGIFLALNIGANPIIFTSIIAMSLTPVTMVTIYHNHRIYNIYKKWPQYLKVPYQWI